MRLSLIFLFLPILACTSESPKCEAGGVVIEKDKNGLNVRDSIKGKIIDAIPNDSMITLSGYKEGWFKITEATYMPQYQDEGLMLKWKHSEEEGMVKRDYNKKEAWISGKYVITYLISNTGNIYESPNTDSKVVSVFKDESMYSVNIVECSGNWIKINYRNTLGWVSAMRHCPNSLTSCDY
ncbi:SH3 domain-containing protein [Leptospira santarosai]|nr:SH3 domain-containing protein [Leptospira santarosai]UZN06678.1 SH3 domain-containing protein [Leptospira santarosai]